jgi:hypothetical protein
MWHGGGSWIDHGEADEPEAERRSVRSQASAEFAAT